MGRMVGILLKPNTLWTKRNVLTDFLSRPKAIVEINIGAPNCRSGLNALSLEEASACDLQLAFRQNKLTSRQLTKFYLYRIRRLNLLLRGVIEDNIATKDKMNTMAGSFTLLGSIVPWDAGVVARLRSAGAVLLGKASLSEWAHYCFSGGQWMRIHVGSSSGSAVCMAANMGAVSLGTETDGSILCPSSSNSVVGIKPTVGLASRSAVIPLTPRQNTVGEVVAKYSDTHLYSQKLLQTCKPLHVGSLRPMCRAVADAVSVLDDIVGFDPSDAEAMREASKYIPRGAYGQFLKPNRLEGKRLGILRSPYHFRSGSLVTNAFESHLNILRKQGAVLLDRLELANIDGIYYDWGERVVISAEFKLDLNTYLQDLVASPVRSLADVIEFNNKHKHVEKNDEFGQDLLSRDGFEKLMRQNKLDAVVTPRHLIRRVLAIGGFPGMSVPAGYDEDGPTLIEIAFGFEQATKIRRPPSFMQGSL
ncbi:hypothetical protein EUGRSUZ_I01384 [Eucalyptus grandis]|uniref:Uncharacterized protein n=2 Tax=Eucalyptus grandis TaxID=71139 RepID=A0ACC3JFL8_EUCGR|nr:hypothetical protein EUGRSUZ_I01384 [Eucalyptus grandis]